MRGIYTALITPFTPSDEIDYPAFGKILADQKASRLAGVVVNGTTGESPCTSMDEKKKMIEFALAELRGSGVKVIAGTGSNDTRESVQFSKWASDAGVDAVLLVTPYYNKPQQAGLESHFLAIADAIRCEAILYNVPGRTGVSLTVESVVKLAAHPRIRSIKEATGNLAFTSELLDALSAAGKSMDVLSGDDPTFLGLLSIGAVGNISVASNLIPRALVEMQKAFESGRPADATLIQRRFSPLFRDLFVESNPVPIKVAMARHGFCDERVRAPLAPISQQSRILLEACLVRCGIRKGEPQ